MATMKERFIELLREEIEQQRRLIEAWEDIEDDGGWLKTDDGGKVTPGERIARCRAKIDELQGIIAKIAPGGDSH